MCTFSFASPPFRDPGPLSQCELPWVYVSLLCARLSASSQIAEPSATASAGMVEVHLSIKPSRSRTLLIWVWVWDVVLLRIRLAGRACSLCATRSGLRFNSDVPPLCCPIFSRARLTGRGLSNYALAAVPKMSYAAQCAFPFRNVRNGLSSLSLVAYGNVVERQGQVLLTQFRVKG